MHHMCHTYLWECVRVTKSGFIYFFYFDFFIHIFLKFFLWLSPIILLNTVHRLVSLVFKRIWCTKHSLLKIRCLVKKWRGTVFLNNYMFSWYMKCFPYPYLGFKDECTKVQFRCSVLNSPYNALIWRSVCA